MNAREKKDWRRMLTEIGGYENEFTAVPAGAVRKMIDEIEALRAAQLTPQAGEAEPAYYAVVDEEGDVIELTKDKQYAHDFINDAIAQAMEQDITLANRWVVMPLYRTAPPRPVGPIPMILFCPSCGLKHIDAPQPEKGWTNPPHRSHECQGCGLIWRPADIETTGVYNIQTRGKNDSAIMPTPSPVAPVWQPPAALLMRIQSWRSGRQGALEEHEIYSLAVDMAEAILSALPPDSPGEERP